eukprot:1311-Prymnesium_polylepis.1
MEEAAAAEYMQAAVGPSGMAAAVCVNGSFNIRTRQGGSGRLGHECADRRYDEKGCRNSMYSGDGHAKR